MPLLEILKINLIGGDKYYMQRYYADASSNMIFQGPQIFPYIPFKCLHNKYDNSGHHRSPATFTPDAQRLAMELSLFSCFNDLGLPSFEHLQLCKWMIPLVLSINAGIFRMYRID